MFIVKVLVHVSDVHNIFYGTEQWKNKLDCVQPDRFSLTPCRRPTSCKQIENELKQTEAAEP